MQELREELNQYGEVVQSLAERAQDVVPLKQRRQPVTRPIPILAICNYKQNNVGIFGHVNQIYWHVRQGLNRYFLTDFHRKGRAVGAAR